jgi:hypothetical protein
MIETNTFSLSSNMYFRISVWVFYKRSRFTYLILFILSVLILMLKDSHDLISWIVFAVALGGPLVSIANIYYLSNDKRNQLYFAPQKIQLTPEKIIQTTEAGVYSEVDLNNILMVKEEANYLLLFFPQWAFYYLDKSAFKSAEDLETAINYLNNRHN